jgi:hypothetical protein
LQLSGTFGNGAGKRVFAAGNAPAQFGHVVNGHRKIPQKCLFSAFKML